MIRPKEYLGKIMRETGDIFTVEKAAHVLDASNTDTSKILGRWTKQGWLTRIKRGLYAVVPIEAETTNQAFEDVWAIVPELFSPCYIGGWSAAEYWDLTEQIFRSVCVLTERSHTKKLMEIRDIPFSLTKISPTLMFGIETIWRKNKKIQISDPHKTVLDMLYNPQLGGGIHHGIDCFREYIRSEHYSPAKLSEYAKKMNNGAVFKRLGYITEGLLGSKHELIELCQNNMRKGPTYLDPKLKNGFFITRWRLYVPKSLKERI